MKNLRKMAVLEVVFASLFLGANGTFVKWVSLPAETILFFRAFFAFVLLYLLVLFSKDSFKLKSKKDYWRMFVVGIFMTLNWLFFFYSVKLSTVAIGMIAIFTFPIMTTFIEPYFYGTKIDFKDILSSIVMFVGVLLLIPEFSLENDVTLGVIFGLLSALVYVFRNLLSKDLLNNYSSSVVMGYQVLLVSIFISPYLFFSGPIEFAPQDIWGLLFLGILGTAVGHTLFVKSLKHLSARAASVITSIQPIYGIILAFFMLGEVPNLQVIIGGIIIIFVVGYEAFRHTPTTDPL